MPFFISRFMAYWYSFIAGFLAAAKENLHTEGTKQLLAAFSFFWLRFCVSCLCAYWKQNKFSSKNPFLSGYNVHLVRRLSLTLARIVCIFRTWCHVYLE